MTGIGGLQKAKAGTVADQEIRQIFLILIIKVLAALVPPKDKRGNLTKAGFTI